VTFHRLRVFVAVAKNRNFSRAAEELDISQPSASLQLKLLEEELGVILFIRNQQGIDLTREGEILLEGAEAILHQVNKIKEQFERITTETEIKTLHIGGSESPSVSLLPSVIGAFKKTRPEIQLFIQSEISAVLEQMVLNSELEIALITNPSHSTKLVYEPFREESILAVVSPRHQVADKKEVSLAELAKELIIIKNGKAGPSTTENFIKEAGKRGYELNNTVFCETADAVKAVVKKGLGIGFLHSDVAGSDIRRGELKAIKIPELNWRVKTFIVYHKERTLSPAAKDFLTFLHKWPRKKAFKASIGGVAAPGS